MPRPLFFFDASQHVLRGSDGEPIKLRPQSLDVFVLLLKSANEVVSKDDILNAVWRGVAVTDDSVTQCIVDIRRALGAEYRTLLQTVPKVGYRLCVGTNDGRLIIAPLGFKDSTTADMPTLAHHATASSDYSLLVAAEPWSTPRRLVLMSCVVGILILLVALGLNKGQQDTNFTLDQSPLRGPTLAVLPFESVATTDEESYFSDGITEDIIVLLSRFSELGLISWNTVSSLASSDKRIEAVAKKFDVRYLVSGSVRQEDGRVRVSVRLTDAKDARLLWSERYDEPLQDVFLVQDLIANQIVSTLTVKLTQFETTLSQNTPTRNIEAYQLSLLGRSELRKRTREGNLLAKERFTEAIELDSRYADAYIQLGEAYLEEALFGWNEWPEQSTDKALLLANTAIELGGANARSLGFLARLHVRIGKNDRAQDYLDRAFSFNSNDPVLHELQGLIYLWNGKANKAVEHLEYVLRYDPGSTISLSHLSTAYYVTGRATEAVKVMERMIDIAPNALFSHIILTAALVESGDVESAKAAAAVVRRQHPFLTADGASRTEFFSSNEVRKRFIVSLRRAGID